jgi:hypothetical protein
MRNVIEISSKDSRRNRAKIGVDSERDRSQRSMRFLLSMMLLSFGYSRCLHSRVKLILGRIAPRQKHNYPT